MTIILIIIFSFFLNLRFLHNFFPSILVISIINIHLIKVKVKHQNKPHYFLNWLLSSVYFSWASFLARKFFERVQFFWTCSIFFFEEVEKWSYKTSSDIGENVVTINSFCFDRSSKIILRIFRSEFLFIYCFFSPKFLGSNSSTSYFENLIFGLNIFFIWTCRLIISNFIFIGLIP